MSTEPTRRSLHQAPTAAEISQLHQEHAREVSDRAETAGRSILRMFGKKAFGVPGTLLGAVQIPETRSRFTRLGEWHFWWQAHLLDCAIDASLRAHREMDSATATTWFETAHAILRGIHTRNLGSWTNSYFDDMAWLALASGRLNALAEILNGRGLIQAQDAGRDLFVALSKGATTDLGGGMFWSTQKDFKNTPATAPAALAFARGAQVDRASALLNWLDAKLWDAERKVYLDGIKIRQDSEELEAALYSYNQGPVLSALLEVAEAGGELNFEVNQRISDILDGIEQHFTATFEVSGVERIKVLSTHGDGDGGLFSGILARYLAQVALSEHVAEEVRSRASALVVQSADILWEGRREFDPELPLNEYGIDVREVRGEPTVLFSTDIVRHASETLGVGTPVQLSSQLQGWMLLESAARVLAASA